MKNKYKDMFKDRSTHVCAELAGQSQYFLLSLFQLSPQFAHLEKNIEQMFHLVDYFKYTNQRAIYILML